jgi:hypothetical protein
VRLSSPGEARRRRAGIRAWRRRGGVCDDQHHHPILFPQDDVARPQPVARQYPGAAAAPERFGSPVWFRREALRLSRASASDWRRNNRAAEGHCDKQRCPHGLQDLCWKYSLSSPAMTALASLFPDPAAARQSASHQDDLPSTPAAAQASALTSPSNTGSPAGAVAEPAPISGASGPNTPLNNPAVASSPLATVTGTNGGAAPATVPPNPQTEPGDSKPQPGSCQQRLSRCNHQLTYRPSRSPWRDAGRGGGLRRGAGGFPWGRRRGASL